MPLLFAPGQISSAPFRSECQPFLSLQRYCFRAGLEARQGRSRLGTSEMASERQIEANQKNAKRSTGPRIPSGKAKSRCNALFHGLSRSTAADGLALAALAGAITNAAKQNGVEFETTDIARAKLQFRQIGTVRHQLLVALLELSVRLAKRLRGLERYERAAFAMQKRGLQFQRGEPQLAKRSQSEQQGGGKQ